MTEGKRDIATDRHDPDDASEPTEEMPDIAEPAIGGKGVRPATGDPGPNGVVRGRPPTMGRTKSQVTLRPNLDALERFRADGLGWQRRINGVLWKAVRLN